jgi:DNA-binding transcriptional regulator YdaS (Cro superfamily)
MTPKQAFGKAVNILGSQAETARRLGVSPQRLAYWWAVGTVPAEFVLPLEEATEAQVTRYDLRPDVYRRTI